MISGVKSFLAISATIIPFGPCTISIIIMLICQISISLVTVHIMVKFITILQALHSLGFSESALWVKDVSMLVVLAVFYRLLALLVIYRRSRK